jgi:hypothetical protein
MLMDNRDSPIDPVLKYRQRAKDAEGKCADLDTETEMWHAKVVRQCKLIDDLKTHLKTLNAAYQRIFDEKVARCEYIAKLELALRKVMQQIDLGCGKTAFSIAEEALKVTGSEPESDGACVWFRRPSGTYTTSCTYHKREFASHALPPENCTNCGQRTIRSGAKP